MEGGGKFRSEEFEYVGEGGGRWGRRSHAEAETVSLVDVVVGVLAKDYGFHGVQRRMA